VLRQEERHQLAVLERDVPDVCWDRLFFSAKESTYKTWFPLTGEWLDFGEVSLTAASDGTFRAYLLVPGPVIDDRRVTTFRGRWVVHRGFVLTAIALPPRRPRNSAILEGLVG
jgi:4'-phosphopantetheinyl transferase EntD